MILYLSLSVIDTIFFIVLIICVVVFYGSSYSELMMDRELNQIVEML